MRQVFPSVASFLWIAIAAHSALGQDGIATIPTVASPSAQVLADLDNDGALDAVVGSSTTTFVSIHRGDGHGGFLSASTFDVGTTVVALAVSDFDQNGTLDLAAVGDFGGGVYSGNGAGGFGPAMFASGGGISVAAADVDQDGSVDLLVGHRSAFDAFGFPPTVYAGGAVVWKGPLTTSSTSQFWPLAGYLSGAAPPLSDAYFECVDVAFGDVNGDHLLDLIGVEHGWSSGPFIPGWIEHLNVRLGDGLGGFGPKVLTGIFISLGGRKGPFIGTVGESNGDGRADIGLSNGEIWLGSSTGAFTQGPSSELLSERLLLSDLNGDGLDDAVATSALQSDFGPGLNNPLVPGPTRTLSSFLVNAAGAAHSRRDQFGFASVLVAPASGDLDGDGHRDVVVLSPSTNQLVRVLGDGAGGFRGVAAFGPVLESAVGATGSVFVATSDLDGDGAPDVLASDGPTVFQSRGQATGAFGIASSLITGTSFSAAAIGDVDRDGIADIAAADLGASVVALLHGSGGGAFAPAGSQPTGSTPIAIALGDLDADGFSDAVTANSAAGTVSVMRGSSSGLGASVDFPTGQKPIAVALADVNHDGRLDVITADFGGNKVSVLLGTGGGSLAAPVSSSCGAGPTSLAVGDLDHDGDVDAVVARPGQATLSILKGNGTAAFGAPTSLYTTITTHPFKPNVALLGDVNDDGVLDVAAVDWSYASATFSYGCAAVLWLGDGAGAFAGGGMLLTSDYESFTHNAHLALADLDADGRLDVLVTGRNGFVGARLAASPAPKGISTFGSGTPGCAGMHGLGANQAPKIGASSFLVSCTNAPHDSLGLGVVAAAAVPAGVDPFAIGVDFHVDLFAPPGIATFDLPSDATGVGQGRLAIPNVPAGVGLTVFAQVLWLWSDECAPSLLGLSSSKGMSITLQAP